MTLEQVVGTTLILLFLSDIFLTVLYARAGTGLLASYWNRATWASLRAAAKLFGKRQRVVLSLAGPLIVVLLVGFWALGLTVGAALMLHPELGISILPSSGETPTDFVTALLVAGNSLSIVGGGDYSPRTTGARILFLNDAGDDAVVPRGDRRTPIVIRNDRVWIENITEDVIEIGPV